MYIVAAFKPSNEIGELLNAVAFTLRTLWSSGSVGAEFERHATLSTP